MLKDNKNVPTLLNVCGTFYTKKKAD